MRKIIVLSVFLFGCSSLDSEKSFFDSSSYLRSTADDGRLQNEWSKNCLSVATDIVKDLPCGGEPSQYVRQKEANDNYVQLVANNKCLQATNKIPGQIIRVKACSKSKEQKFLIQRLSVNRVQFVSQYGLCLTVPYNRILVQNDCGGVRTSFQTFGPVADPLPEKPTSEKWVRDNHKVIVDGNKTILIPTLASVPNSQKIVGLLVLVDFDDMAFTTTSVFDAALKLNHDLRGYALYQKNVDLQHIVIGNFRSSKPYAYFMETNHPEKPNEYIRSRELISELYAKLREISQFNFSSLTLHNTWTPNYVVNSFMMLFAADADSGRAGYARGLWPVSAWQSGKVQNTEFAHYQESAIIQSRKDFQMGTIIHETGHQVMGLGEDQGDWGNANWDSWCTTNCLRY